MRTTLIGLLRRLVPAKPALLAPPPLPTQPVISTTIQSVIRPVALNPTARPQYDGAGRYRGLVQFPKIGGEDGPPDMSALFADPYILTKLAGGVITYVYLAGCLGLWELGKSLGIPVFKAGTTSNPDIRQRLSALGVDRYGSVTFGPDGPSCGLGFDRWDADHLPPSLNIAQHSAVSIVGRALQVRLPIGMTPAQFEERLSDALLPVALHVYADTQEGRAYLIGKGVHPSQAFRYTEYRYGLAARLSTASEIYIYRRGQDEWRLVRLIENIILEAITDARG